MTIKKLTYFCLALLTGFFSACSDDGLLNTLSGTGEKTPVSVTALLDASGAAKTRAVNMTFDENDKLLAYVRHVKWVAPDGARTLVSVDNSPKLVTFTKGSGAMAAYDGTDIKPIGLTEALGLTSTNTQKATDLAASPTLYWDDFSANDPALDGTDASLNLRDAGHYLQSYYGYCYNGSPAYGEDGSHITVALDEGTGRLGWKVENDQTVAGAFKTSDLLWSAEQTPVPYAHVDGEGKRNHGTLVLPYTHAMSKVTINVSLHESFTGGVDFSGVTTMLHEMFTHCICTAPTYTLTEKGTATVGEVDDIVMRNNNTASGKTTACTFDAIVVPSILAVVNNFATITGLDGNSYVIPITEAMLQVPSASNGNTGWGGQLTETDEHINNGTAQARPLGKTSTVTIEEGRGYEMKPGVNYVLNVNISKQGITVSALIRDWVEVNAEGVALVQFTPDVNAKGDIDDGLKAGGFDVFKNSVNTAFESKTTTLAWDNTHAKWTYDPVIYWAGQDDASYFRALSPSNASLDMNQGTDILWGYACDDEVNNRSRIGEPGEVAITPRTGDVPLHFEHPMSKVSVKLETAEGSASDPTSAAVDLTGAQIEITNLVTTGTLELVKGMITPAPEKTATAITGTFSVSDLPVIPQAIGSDAVLRITLKDGTVYKLQLNTCVDSNSTADPKPAITSWERGRHYTYTIRIEKEAITFRALIKDWDEKNGSGNATLEWD